MPCFIMLAALMELRLPEDAWFQKWFERKLAEKFGVKKHERLKRKLNIAYEDSPYKLKLLFQTLLAEYHKMIPEPRPAAKKIKGNLEIPGIV